MRFEYSCCDTQEKVEFALLYSAELKMTLHLDTQAFEEETIYFFQGK